MSKFLQRYPQLKKIDIGDTIQVINTDITGDECFSIGDIGVVIDIDLAFAGYTIFEIDFNNQGNKKVIQHGNWWIADSEVRILQCASS